MELNYNAVMPYLIHLLFILSCLLYSSLGQLLDDGENYYNRLPQYSVVKMALNKLEPGPEWVENWPDPSVKLGQVSGLALDNNGNLFVFHRGPNVWDAQTFSSKDVYQNIGEAPIPEPTILVFNETGELIDMWGENLFHMPHGITVDKDGNVWVTDVAMHQVFKFTPKQRKVPTITLGEKFVPRDDDNHFCKPSAVAVLSTGDFFVADGYCNSRIIKYAPDGTRILQWGRHAGGHSPYSFQVPHALTLAENHGLVCVADREQGRVACFRHDDGTFVQKFSSWLMGPRIFSVAYAPVNGGRLYVVNGIGGFAIEIRGFVIDFTSGRLLQTFTPESGLRNPHDVVASPDGSRVYVCELNPYKVHKFVDDRLITNQSKKEHLSDLTRASPFKPTATIEITNTTVPSTVWETWRSAAGGAAGAAGAALLALAAIALLKARNKGRKSMPRRRWEYGGGEFKLRRLLERRGGRGGRGGRFTRVHSDDSEDEPAPMLPPEPIANA